MSDIIKNIDKVIQRIEKACQNANRNPQEVKLLLATKTVSAERIKVALNAGYTLIAENKVQEVREKAKELENTPHTSHFIGHLQTNKIKYLIRHGISCIESVDRLRLVEKLHNRLKFEDKEMDILVQVNTSGEKSKFGLNPNEVHSFIKKVSEYENIHIKGLMTIGLFDADLEKVRKCFQLLRELKNEVEKEGIPNVQMKELSMGMSKDLEVAIEEGATIIRIGTDIFGKRKYPDSYYWNEG